MEVNFIIMFPEKIKLKQESMAELKLKLITFTKLLRSKMNSIENFNDFKKEKKFIRDQTIERR